MHKLMIIGWALLLLGFWAQAQPMEKEWEQKIESASGSAKIQLQIEAARAWQQHDLKIAIDWAEDATKASDRTEDWGQYYESAYLLGELHFAATHYRRAANAIDEAIEAAQQMQAEYKQLSALALLREIYKTDGRSRKLQQTTELYNALKNKLDLRVRNEELSELEEDYVAATEDMEVIADRLDKTEIARRLLEEEKLRLENTTLNLRNDSIQQALELVEEANKVLELRAKTKRQQNLLLVVALITVFIFVLSFLWIWAVRQKRKQEAQQAILKQQLLQKDKMAALGALTAGVAHEIKNPLNFVNNFAEGSIDMLSELQETLQEQLADLPPERAAQYDFLLEELKQNANDIHKQGKRADAIINSMMNHAKGGNAESRKVDINALLLDSWNLARGGAVGKYKLPEISLQQDLAQDLPAIRVIPQDLNRAFLNIFTNSLEAFAERQIPSPQISLFTKKSAGQLQVSIRDNAGGITPKIIKQVFNPFFTTKPTGKGNTGLGLSIAHDIIVKGHDGAFDLSSDGQTYTEIRLSLPLLRK